MFYYGACDSLSISITYGSEMSKLRILCLAAASAISASAASPMKTYPNGVSGWGLGFAADNNNLLGGALVLDYKWATGEAGVSFMADNNHAAAVEKSWNTFDFGVYYGMRKMIKPMLALSVGAEGSILAVDRWSHFGGGDSFALTSQPYAVGIYSQMSWEPTRYLSQYVRIAPVSYQESGYEAANCVGIFNKVKVGMTYYWNS